MQHGSHSSEIPRTPFRFIWHTVKPFWPLLVLGIIFSVTTQLLNTYTAVFIGQFADMSQRFQAPEEFAYWAVLFIGLLSLSFLFFRLSGFTAIALIMRQHPYAFQLIKSHLLRHSHTYFIDRFAGSVASKAFHAGDRGSDLLMISYNGFVRLAIGLLSTGVVIAIFNVWLGVAYLFILAVTVGINYLLVQRRRPHVVEHAKAASKYRGQITDVVTNIQAARQYARVPFEYNFLNQVLDELVQKDRKQWTMGEMNHVINNVLTIVLMTVMVGGMYMLLVQGLVSVGQMISVMILMYRVAGIIVDLGDWMNRLIRVYGEVEEGLNDVFLEHEIIDQPAAVDLEIDAAHIRWKNVHFKFGEHIVFDNLNLTIGSGQRLGLVGQSGAGKTTFVSLLLRQHDINGGEIMIDGQNIANVTQDSLRAHIAVVPQEPLLFHRSIKENIAYGKPSASSEEIIAVAQMAEAHDFICDLPQGYDTLVGERGVKLSGGQKQRVAIARAMLKDAPILVLDEATSALDSESEVAIQKALEKLMEGRTVIAIAHRLSTLRKMDRIIVMDQGRIVEDGTHESLAEAEGTYQRLWQHQAGGFLVE